MEDLTGTSDKDSTIHPLRSPPCLSRRCRRTRMFSWSATGLRPPTTMSDNDPKDSSALRRRHTGRRRSAPPSQEDQVRRFRLPRLNWISGHRWILRIRTRTAADVGQGFSRSVSPPICRCRTNMILMDTTITHPAPPIAQAPGRL